MSPREKNRAIQTEVQKAIGDIAKKYGLVVPVVSTRFARDGSKFRISMIDMVPALSVPKVPKPTSTDIGDPILASGLKRYGITNTTNSRGERIVAYKANRPKYPFVMEGPRGGRWKLAAADAVVKFA